MDTLDKYRQLIQQILIEYTKIPYAYGKIEFETIFDRESDRYSLMIVGWENGRRVHGCLIHIDIINGKLWIQRDGTEQGIATEFINAGVPKEQIVLAFHAPEVRQHTGYAIA